MLHLVVAAALLVQSPQQFDLVCTGTMTSGSSLTGYEVKPHTSRIRVDLAGNRYCVEACPAPLTIASVSAAEIVFNYVDSAENSQNYKVSRTTGALLNAISIGPRGREIRLTTEAQCVRADFSGMPTAAF